MERRYLVATLALAATFVVFSQAFGAGRLAKLPRSRAEVQADIACVRRTVAERIMAKLAPYVDSRAPEQAQMVAELNLPQLAQVEQQANDAQRIGSGAGRTPEVPGSDAGPADGAARIPDADSHRRSCAAAQRPRHCSVREEWRDMADARRIEIDARAIARAQQVSARAMAQAQRAMEHSRVKVAYPQPGMPIHINFVAPGAA